MASIGELTREMDGLEEASRRVLGNPELTALERRQAMECLLRRYNVLADYRQALAVYLARMLREDGAEEDPEDVIEEMLASPEFGLVRLAVFVVLLAVVYGGGPRSGLVPVALLAALTRAAPRRFL